MIIKKATLDYLPEIKKLSEKYDFETNRDWKNLISSENKSMYVLINDDKKLIGFSGLIKFDWNNTMQISNIFIHPDFRRKGLSTKLILYVIGEAKKTSSRCLIAEAPSLNPVLKLYKKLGFRKCGYNDRYYSNDSKEICIWMSLDL